MNSLVCEFLKKARKTVASSAVFLPCLAALILPFPL
jgi:hypothetical protein